MKCKTRFNVMVGKRHAHTASAQPVDSFLVCVHTASAPPSRRRCQRKSQSVKKESNNSPDTTWRTAQRGAARNRSDETSACTAVESLSGAHSMACVRLRGSAQSNGPTSAPLLSQSGSRTSHPTDLRVRSHGHSAAR